jgi:hypothetical protein
MAETQQLTANEIDALKAVAAAELERQKREAELAVENAPERVAARQHATAVLENFGAGVDPSSITPAVLAQRQAERSLAHCVVTALNNPGLAQAPPEAWNADTRRAMAFLQWCKQDVRRDMLDPAVQRGWIAANGPLLGLT